MKTKTTLFIILCISLVFSGCFSPWASEKQGKLIVSIGVGNGQAREVWFNDYNTDYLLHIVTITGFGRKQEARFIGSGTASFFVPTGHWNVKVKAYDITGLNNIDNLDAIDVVALYLPLVADGSADVNVKIGDNAVSVKMGQPGRDRLPPPKNNEFTITLMLGGGEYVDADYSKVYFVATGIYYVYVSLGNSYILKTPTRQGFVFLGWFTGKDELITIVDNDYDITLYARWVEKVAGASTLKIGVVRGQDGKTLTLEKWGTVTIESPDQTGELLTNEGYYYSWEMVNIPKGTKIRIKADPYDSNSFVEWRDNFLFDKGKKISDEKEYSFDIQENTTLYAVFEKKDTINITSVADLKKIVDTSESNYPLSGNYNLMADLDFSILSGNWTPIGNESTKFTGTFNGMGHTINLNIATVSETSSTTSYAGLFGYIGNEGIVKNLKLEGNIKINNLNKDVWVGAVAGANFGSIINVISNVSIKQEGNITYDIYAGGIAGQNNKTIINCAVTGEINVYSSNSIDGAKAGGIVCRNGGSGTVEYCWASGSVNGYKQAGGIVGNIIGGSIKNCVALNWQISTTVRDAPVNIGRIAAEYYDNLQNNYAISNMSVNGSNNAQSSTDAASINGKNFTSLSSSDWIGTSGPNWSGGSTETNPWNFPSSTNASGNYHPILWFENYLGYE